MKRLDWPAINGTVAGVGIVLLWLYWMLLLASRAAWSHQAAHAALAGWR